MSNWTFTRISVVGRKECVNEFIKVLNANYDYYYYNFDHKFHVFKTWVQSYDHEIYGQIMQADIYVECAWSVYVCMFKGPNTYYNDRVGLYNRAVSIDELSKIYGLNIEIWSEESGMCFQEHYYIINGNIIINEEFSSKHGYIYIDDINYDEYINIYKDCNMKPKLTESEFNKLKNSDSNYIIDPPEYKEWDFHRNVLFAKPNNMFYVDMVKLLDNRM